LEVLMNGEGSLANVLVLRSVLGADVIVIVVRQDTSSRAIGMAGALGANNLTDAVVVVQQQSIGNPAFPTMAHELGHLFGAGHNQDCCGEPPYTNTLAPYAHGYHVTTSDGYTHNSAVAKGIPNVLFRLQYSTPYAQVATGYPIGIEESNYNSRIIFERRSLLAHLNEPNYNPSFPQGPPANGPCNTWIAACADNSRYTEDRCSVQQLFNSVWHPTWPGGG